MFTLSDYQLLKLKELLYQFIQVHAADNDNTVNALNTTLISDHIDLELYRRQFSNTDPIIDDIAIIIDTFESYFEKHDVSIPNQDRDNDINNGYINAEEAAIIYADHYYVLESEIIEILNVEL